MKIIFLDIDGVLINIGTVYQHRADPECVRRLNEITDRSGAKIVVSSSWRDDPKIAEVLKGWGVTGAIIGITPRIETLIGNGGHVLFSPTRGHEIQAWLYEHHEKYEVKPDDICILDDDSDMGELGFALVQTDFETGLTDNHVKDALVMLE